MSGAVDDSAASGRPALAETRDRDWERVVKHTHSLPFKARKWGEARAISWGRTQLRSLLGLVSLDADNPVTPQQAKAIRAVRAYLTTGPLLVMCRSDAIGLAMRTRFLELAETALLEPSLRAVFRRTPAVTESRYQPQVAEKPEDLT